MIVLGRTPGGVEINHDDVGRLSRPSNARSSTAGGWPPRTKPAWPSSSSSRDGTIRAGANHRSATCHPSTSKGTSNTSLAQVTNSPRDRGNSTHGMNVRVGSAAVQRWHRQDGPQLQVKRKEMVKKRKSPLEGRLSGVERSYRQRRPNVAW